MTPLSSERAHSTRDLSHVSVSMPPARAGAHL